MSKMYIDAANKYVGATILYYDGETLYYMPENIADIEDTSKLKEVDPEDYLKLLAFDALVGTIVDDGMKFKFLKDLTMSFPDYDDKVYLNELIPVEMNVASDDNGGGSSEFVGIYYDKNTGSYYEDSRKTIEISSDDLWEYYKKDARIFFDYRWHSFTSCHTRSGVFTIGFLPSEKVIYVDEDGKYYANKSGYPTATYSDEITDGYALRSIFEEGYMIEGPDNSVYRPVGYNPTTNKFVFDVPDYLK